MAAGALRAAAAPLRWTGHGVPVRLAPKRSLSAAAAPRDAADVVLLFPGQGSQQLRMAADLDGKFPEARAVLDEVEAATGLPLRRTMRDGPEAALASTEICQPAILAHSVAVFRILQPLLAGRVYAVLGHSLGEFSAAVCAGSLGLADAALLVRARGRAMQTAADALGVPHKMVTLMLRDPTGVAAVQALVDQLALEGQLISIAGVNGPTQVTLSGAAAAVDAVAQAAQRDKVAARAIPLSVSAPFHSPAMRPDVVILALAAAVVRAELERISIRDPAWPVYSVALAAKVETAQELAAALVAQTEQTVRWHAALSACLQDAGGRVRHLLELGPGRVLTGLAVRSIRTVPSRYTVKTVQLLARQLLTVALANQVGLD